MYDNQNALVIAYSPTGRGYDAPCSIGLYPDTVNLFFVQGAQVSKSDPNMLLQGRGKTLRHGVLNRAGDFVKADMLEPFILNRFARASRQRLAGTR